MKYHQYIQYILPYLYISVYQSIFPKLFLKTPCNSFLKKASFNTIFQFFYNVFSLLADIILEICKVSSN